MRRLLLPMLLLVLLVLMPAVSAVAKERDFVRVLLRTDPEGARVYLVTSDPRPAPLPHFSGESMPLNPSDPNLRSIFHGNEPTVQLIFRKPGYYAPPQDVPRTVLEYGGVWPGGKPLPLTPTWWTILTSLPVLGGTAAVLIAVGLAWSLRRKGRQQIEEAARYTSRVVPMEGDQLLGSWLGDYMLVERLGRGGMAVVYRVIRRHRPEEEGLALKLLNPECCEDEEFIDRFCREVKICQRLVHPNLVQLYDFNVEGKSKYTVMELVPGHTLREEIPPAGLPLKRVLKLLEPVFEGVGHAHSQGVMHRDLKPENVLIARPGEVVKVADFGLARRHDSTTITRTGSVFGTPAYMAPEQIDEGELTGAVDQYALGVMAFEMLAGHPPFDAESPIGVIMKHLSEPPPDVAEVRPDLPAEVGQVVARMMAKDADDRFPTLGQAFEALRRAEQG